MSFETAIVIILTALAVMLAILTLIIGALAFWGFVGMRDQIKEAVSKDVTPVILKMMEEKVRQIPDAAQYLSRLQAMQEKLDFLDSIQSKIVTSPAAKTVASASKTDVEETLEKPTENTTPIEEYPGEEPRRASKPNTAPAAEPESGPDNQKPPEKRSG